MVDDDHLTTRYIASAPGAKTGKRYHPQTREWWIVTGGQIRFEIEGQEPFVASQGWMVQVPPRTIYSLETIGDKPSLRYEVNIAHAQTLYPEDQKPPAFPRISWMPVKSARIPAPYDRGNKPYLIFDEVAANIEKAQVRGGNRFINDDRGVANIIYGYEKNLPPESPDEKGHWHPECAETWLIMAGQIKYKIEGQPVFVADKGDVVYAPRFMWHHATFAGPGPSCRLAMTGYPGITSLVNPWVVRAVRVGVSDYSCIGTHSEACLTILLLILQPATHMAIRSHSSIPWMLPTRDAGSFAYRMTARTASSGN